MTPPEIAGVIVEGHEPAISKQWLKMAEIAGNAGVVVKVIDQEHRDGMRPGNAGAGRLNHFDDVGHAGGGEAPFELFQRVAKGSHTVCRTQPTVMGIDRVQLCRGPNRLHYARQDHAVARPQ